MGTVHACHQVNQLRPLHFVTPLLVIPRESESGTMLVSTDFYFLSERPCLFLYKVRVWTNFVAVTYCAATPVTPPPGHHTGPPPLKPTPLITPPLTLHGHTIPATEKKCYSSDHALQERKDPAETQGATNQRPRLSLGQPVISSRAHPCRYQVSFFMITRGAHPAPAVPTHNSVGLTG